ncbi:MAG TPA: S26 family signal peptidase, partial [Pirellulales bacterium]|nr:S26 family signal peptidase [Pirellulales bacterium]
MPKAALQIRSTRLVHPRRRLRRTLDAGVCLLIAALLVGAWHVERFEVPSGSMAPTLLGRHRRLTCRDCGHAFDCGADEDAMQGKRAVCPNCGYVGQELASAPALRGDRVLAHRAAFELRPPRRWELAAFRNPLAASQIFVKRVAGLPNETIEIRHGDVYADGAIQRKTLVEQQAMAILVHDANARPTRTAGLPPRWQGEPETTRWQAANGRFVYPPLKRPATHGDEPPGIDWLTYRHWRRRPGLPDEADEAPITDLCGYNQTRPVVRPYQVRDLLVSCRLRVSGVGSLAWFVTDGQAQFILELFPARRRAELRRDGALVASADGLPELTGREVRFVLSLFDQQALLALDGQTILVHPYRPDASPFRPTSRPLAIGSRGLGIEIRDIRLYRDVYYTPPAGGPGRAPGSGVVQYRL